MTVLVVAGLVFVACLLPPPGGARRLRRLLAMDGVKTRERTRGHGACGCGAAVSKLGRGHPWRRRREGAEDAVRTVAEIATLLRAGLPAQRVWAQLLTRRPRASGSSPPADTAFSCTRRKPCHSPLDAGWERLLQDAHSASLEGASIAAVLRAGADACSPEVRPVVQSLAAAWEVSERTGAATAGVLDRLAEGLRADVDDRDARAVAMAGPRATARVLACLPFVGLVLGQLVGADPVQVLLTTPVGRACGGAGLLLAGAAAVWTRRLVKLAEKLP